MELERGLLAAVLGLLSGAWLPAVSVQPRTQAPPTQPWAASDQRGALAPAPPAWGSWKAFLGLQDGGRWGPGATGRALALPLDPQEVAQERCRAVPFVQVRSQGRNGPQMESWELSKSCTLAGAGHEPGTLGAAGPQPR